MEGRRFRDIVTPKIGRLRARSPETTAPSRYAQPDTCLRPSRMAPRALMAKSNRFNDLQPHRPPSQQCREAVFPKWESQTLPAEVAVAGAFWHTPISAISGPIQGTCATG